MKKLICIFGSLLITASLFAHDFRITVGPKYNLQNGVLNEFVFYNDSDKNCQKLSELNWNIKNSSSLGLDASFGYKFLDLSCSLSGSIPGLSGVMYDSDWMNYKDPSMKTNYSISTNKIKNGFDGKVSASGYFDPLKWLVIKPFVNFSFSNISFVSSNAEGWYGDAYSSGTANGVPWDDENAKHYPVGTLCSIDYVRKTLNIYTGLGLSFNPIKPLLINVSGAVAPYNSVTSVDTHWSNTQKTYGSMYKDVMKGYFNFYSASLGIEYRIIELLSVGVCGEYNYIHLIKGVTYTSNTASKKYPTKPSSTSYSGCSGYTINASLYVSFHL